jgi:superoxide dismutase
MSSNQTNYLAVDVLIMLSVLVLGFAYYVAYKVLKEEYYGELRRRGVRV